jgi:hypothetical protein
LDRAGYRKRRIGAGDVAISEAQKAAKRFVEASARRSGAMRRFPSRRGSLS